MALPQDLPAFARELHALIGCFDLDPNRCLDLLLDAAAAQMATANAAATPTTNAPTATNASAPSSSSGVANGVASKPTAVSREAQQRSLQLLQAVGLLKSEAVGQLMGFKLQQHQDPSRAPAPKSLMLVAAQLVATGRCSLQGLLGHLAPSDEQQASGQRAAREALLKRVAEIGLISLSDGKEAAKEGGKEGGKDGAKESGRAVWKEMKREERKEEDKGPSRATGVSASLFELDPEAAVGAMALGPDPQHNQPLALLDALLEVG